MKKFFVLASLYVVLAGCPPPGTIPVGIDDAVRGLETDLRKLGYLSISDLLSENENNKKSVEKYIRSKQCFFKTPNPILVFALHSELILELKGSFNEEGSFTISGIPTPEVGMGVEITSQSEQTIRWPVKVSSLSALPDEYFVEAVKVLETEGLTDKKKTELVNEMFKNYDKLKEKIGILEKSFDINDCEEE